MSNYYPIQHETVNFVFNKLYSWQLADSEMNLQMTPGAACNMGLKRITLKLKGPQGKPMDIFGNLLIIRT